MKTIKWNTTKEEIESIRKVMERIHKMHPDVFNHMDTSMDITACHCNGNSLDFEKLLNFDDFNFNHDIFGIVNSISRTTGELKNCFVPKCSK